jgi:hypothetical protein
MASSLLVATATIADDSSLLAGVQGLLVKIEMLVGSVSPFQSNSAWRPFDGQLKALKQDTLLLLSCFGEQIAAAAELQRLTSKCCLHAGEIRDLAMQLTFEAAPHRYKAFAELQKAEARMHLVLKQLGGAISKLAMHFVNNENVLFCLVDRHQQIDAIYGLGHTFALLKKMGLSLNATHELLLDAYRKRGFDALLPVISQKVNLMRKLQ